MHQDENRPRDGKDLLPKRSPKDAFELYGDEQDLPVRRKKPNKKRKKKRRPSNARPTSGGRQAAVRRKKKPAKKRTFFEWLVYGTQSRKRGSGFHIFGKTVHFSFWPTFLAIAAALIIGILFLQGSDILVETLDLHIVGLPSDLEGYRILHLSDLNGQRFGDEQAVLLREIGTLGYDAVFITGDMVGEGGDPEPFYELLDGLPSSKPVYFIAGDSDPGPYVEVPREIEATLEEMIYEDWILGAIERGATYVDKPVKLVIRDSTIWITPADMLNLRADELEKSTEQQMEQEESGTLAGLQQDYDTVPITTHRFRRASALFEATINMPETDVHISLAHIPPTDAYLEASASHNRAEEKYLPSPTIVLAGHHCGGVWNIPFVGAFYIPNETAPRRGWFPAEEDVKGLSSAGDSQVYISAGLSSCGDTPLMPFRLFNRPQISVLTLTATLPENMLEQ